MPIDEDFGPKRSQDQALIRALGELPLESPPSDSWPALAAELGRRSVKPAAHRLRRSGRRRGWWLAVAATAVLALALPPLLSPPPQRPLTESAGGAEDAGLAELIAHSQWLERLIDAPALSPAAQDADQLLIEFGLRQRIGHIDAALTGMTEVDAEALWRERVGTLTQLAQVRWAGQQLAWSATNEAAAAVPAMRWSN